MLIQDLKTECRRVDEVEEYNELVYDAWKKKKMNKEFINEKWRKLLILFEKGKGKYFDGNEGSRRQRETEQQKQQLKKENKCRTKRFYSIHRTKWRANKTEWEKYKE